MNNLDSVLEDGARLREVIVFSVSALGRISSRKSNESQIFTGLTEARKYWEEIKTIAAKYPDSDWIRAKLEDFLPKARRALPEPLFLDIYGTK